MSTRRPLLSCALVAALTAVAAPPLTTTAHAATTATTFEYTGESTDTVQFFDVFIYASGCSDPDDDPTTCFPDGFPGTAWARVRAGVHSTVISAQSADFALDGPDAFRAGSGAAFTSTLNAVDAAGKEVVLRTTPWVNADVAYDEPWADCPKNTFTSGPHLTETTTEPDCIDFLGHTGELNITEDLELLAKDTTLPYSGDRALSQTASSPTLDVGALIGMPPDLVGVRLDFVTDLLLTATQGYHATRVLAASGGGTLATAPVQWPSTAPQADNAQLSCAAPVGDNLVYKLQDNRWSGEGDATGTLQLVIELAVLDDPTFPLASVPLYDAPVLSTAQDFSKTLGEIRAENLAPTVGVAPVSPTTEGSATTFSIVGTGPGGSLDNCDPSGSTLTYRWTFDDGTSAFGRTVHHAFPDNNGSSPRTAHVDVTDRAGNTRGLDVSVPVANAAPVVGAGPDAGAAWGRRVDFNGTATDPGSGDQSTLAYSWDFGDGSPSATGGPSVTHEYGAPGEYTATLTACDKDGACATDARTVSVRKRAVGLGYTGDRAGAYDTPARFAASLVDEFGQPVQARQLQLQLGTQSFAMTTDADGDASRSQVITQDAGAHTVQALFAGDALYEPSAPTGDDFWVFHKETRTTYTGATSSKPNKTVSLSAYVEDAAGKPLAGRPVAFVLGDQTATAVTDAAGNAATTLKLAQKNGTYPLSATYSPSGVDAPRYSGSSDAETFSLQTR